MDDGREIASLARARIASESRSMSSFTFVSARARRATTRARMPASITAAIALVLFVLATCARAMENPFTRRRDGDRGEVKDSEVILEARTTITC